MSSRTAVASGPRWAEPCSRRRYALDSGESRERERQPEATAEGTADGETTSQPALTLPLSFGQQRLWFLEQIDAAGEAYHMPAFCALRGRLQVPALAVAIGGILHRHEVLRTAYQGRGEDAVQVVLPPPARVT